METVEMIKIMQAFVDGKEIETPSMDHSRWVVCQYPSWNWDDYEYRIKRTTPKYRKLNSEELKTLIGKKMISKKNKAIYIVTAYYEYQSHNATLLLGKLEYQSSDLLDEFTYEDGSPVGKLEE